MGIPGERSLPGSPAKICPYPFSRIELGHSTYVPCCRDWLEDEYFALEPGENPWNGPAALELRRRILRGDYSLCKRHLCHMHLKTLPELEADPSYISEAPINASVIRAMLEGEEVLPEGPISVSIIADPRCNLACPSCRSDYVLQIDEATEKQLEDVRLFLLRHSRDIKVVKMAGNGEVLFSPWLRDLLKGFSRENYPGLDHVLLLTNGLSLDEKNLSALRPGSDLIQRVMVSIDSGTPEVYGHVRGGNWERLMRNLEWLSEQRRKGRFQWICITFVVRTANFRTIPQFVELGHRLQVDEVHFSTFVKWPGMRIKDFEAEAVHLPGHPEHEEFKKIYLAYRSHPLAFFSISVDESAR